MVMAMLWYFTILLPTFGLLHSIEGRECPPGESVCTDGILQPYVCYNSSRSYCYKGGVVCPHSDRLCGRTCYNSRISMCRGGKVKDRPSTACDGSYLKGCGCDHGFCYSFKTIPGVANEPWCWTQLLGVAEPEGKFASCTNHSQCDVQMTCGDVVEYRGGAEHLPTTTVARRTKSEISWTGNMGVACDWPSHDIGSVASSNPENCNRHCAATPRCTHFVWIPAHKDDQGSGEMCFMKSGIISRSDAIANPIRNLAARAKSVCGLLTSLTPPLDQPACDGNFTSGCGCDHGFCYKFKTVPGVAYEPWCWTQQLGVAKPQGDYAFCTNHNQCSVQMTCGDGVDRRGPVTSGPTVKTCDGNYPTGCGCEHGFCYKFKTIPGVAYEPWCWTQQLGVAEPQAEYVSCTNHSQCSVQMACGDWVEHRGGVSKGPTTKDISTVKEKIIWTGNWGQACDWSGNDFRHVPSSGAEHCNDQCAAIEICTHFTWTPKHANVTDDTCFMKRGAVNKSDAIVSRIRDRDIRRKAVCGLVHAIVWTGNRGLACDWPGNDIHSVPSPSAEHCNSQCAATLNCTHFTWTLAHDEYGDTCFLKSGAVQKSHAVSSTIVRAKAICGLVEEVPEKRSSQFPVSSRNVEIGAITGSLIGGVLLLAVALAVVVFVLVRWRKGQPRKELREWFQQDNANRGIGLEYLAMATMSGDRQQDLKLNSIYSQYTKMLEIAPAKLEISTDVLGKGEFGMVFKGLAHDLPCRSKKATTVAAKTLIGSITPEQTQAFIDEFKIMLKCGHHVNIVNILGVVLEGPRPFLLLEFCSDGSLLAYLKRHKISPPPDKAPEEPKVINPYCTKASIVGPSASALLQDSLTPDELVRFCYQISRGMEHLASRFIVHRDLAARNILVSDGKILKISDFGLARTGESYMVSNARVALPVLWMPPEAIVSRHFSQKSDVWSFGVLMWELFSLGQVPFDRPEVEKFSASAYEAMQICWRLEADDRPTFTDIRAKLDGFLCKNGNDSSPYLILTGNDCNSYAAFEKLDEEMLSCLQIPSAEARYTSI
ncbi:putative Vascular endothelial growth factor receptor 3 [Hypsibius exemplaris]|uniref:Vascular endothelial growth factor receptor 3 n=1 Tax=Hypsibius exemplaris TaxID=2072580 RepID=A0A9X6NLF9_HYPEX|nr:putative Vascular endothelial growth factor receptor 3 [Hypsibius exemplaris]